MKYILIIITIILSINTVFAEQILPNEINSITYYIHAKTTGQKGKNFYLCANSTPCSTENIVKEYYTSRNYKVMRAEVAVWQGLFALAFFDEIFYNHDFTLSADLPQNFFNDDELYISHKAMYDQKYKLIYNSNDLNTYINTQLQKLGNIETRILHDGPLEGYNNCAEYISSDIVQNFLKTIDSKIFAKIVYRIAQNPNKNRAGIADYVIWNDKEIFFIEVKRENEKLRTKQIDWALFMLNNKIPIKIIRVKSI